MIYGLHDHSYMDLLNGLMNGSYDGFEIRPYNGLDLVTELEIGHGLFLKYLDGL